MKRLFFVLSGSLLILSACGNEAETGKSEDVREESVKKEVEKKEKKTPYESIVLNEKHPLFLDDLDSVLAFAKEHPKKYITLENVGGKSYSAYRDETIIFYKGYDYNGFVTDIQIYLEKANQEMSVDDALSLANEYLASDFIKQNYSVVDSFKIVPNDDNKTDKKENVVIEYRKKDESLKQPNSFYVSIESEDGKVDQVLLRDEMPKWINFLDRNGLMKEDFNLN